MGNRLWENDNHLYSDDESESDISDIAESDNHESDDEDMDDTDTPDDDDDDQSDSEDDSDNEDNGVDEVDYNMAEFFQNDNCCIHELLEPFLEALKQTNQYDVVQEIRKLDDENEQSCLRFDKWFSPHEKDECVMMMNEILFNFNSEGTKYFNPNSVGLLDVA